MKQPLSLLLIVLAVICLTSCGSDEIDREKENSSMNSSEISSEVTSAPDLYENEPPADTPKTNFVPQAPVNENDHYPDSNAPEPDIYGGEAIELQG